MASSPSCATRASSRRRARSTAGRSSSRRSCTRTSSSRGRSSPCHTDVPEFRGANRKLYPQWLMVVMHHSGLFDEYRLPIATAVGWFNACHGGGFAFYPQGGDGPAATIPARANTGIILDTDSVFHGVDP